MKSFELGLRGNRCLCGTCGDRFNSAAAFDAHRTGVMDPTSPYYGRSCLTVTEMAGKGMAKNPKGFWLTPRKEPRRTSGTPAYATREARLRANRQRGGGPASTWLECSLAGVGRNSA